MARRDDDFELLGGEGPSGGDRLMGALFIVLGAAIFLGTFGVMLYQTDKGLESHNMHTFLTTFGLVLVIGLPVFSGGIWLFKRGMRAWKGEAAQE